MVTLFIVSLLFNVLLSAFTIWLIVEGNKVVTCDECPAQVFKSINLDKDER